MSIRHPLSDLLDKETRERVAKQREQRRRTKQTF